MKIVDKIIDGICEEVCGAMKYGEKYLKYKKPNQAWARMYAEMAQQELDHAESLISIGQDQIAELAWIPEEDKEAWDHCIAKCSEKAAMVKLMLTK